MELTREMHKTILGFSLAAAGVGIPGAFDAHGDIPVLIGLWSSMFIILAQQAGKQLEKAKAAKIVAGLITGISAFVGGAKLASTYFAWTGIGTVPAVLANASTNGILTYLVGKAAGRVFLSGSMERPSEIIVAAILAGLTDFGAGDASDLT